MPIPTPLPYSHTTLAQARYALSLRLLDPTFTYFPIPSLNYLITASIRTTQALTAFFREYDGFLTTPSVPFYDITNYPLTSAGNTPPGSGNTDNVFGYSVFDTDLIKQIEYYLLEPPTSSQWTGSSQFTLDQISQALQKRINQFLLDTGCVLTRPVFPNVTATVGRVPLLDLTLAVRRAAFVDSTPLAPLPPIYSTLWRQDEFSATAFKTGWLNTPTTPPSSYSLAASPPDTLQLIPPPSNNGQLDLLIVQSGPNLAPFAAPTLLGVPDDFSQYVMWGALADLLSADGQARDFTRAAYCTQRYAEGVALAGAFPSLLNAYVNGVPAYTCAVSELDAFNTNWQNQAGVPYTIGLAGRNQVALSPIPDTHGPYSINFDLVRNIPVPVTDADYIQIPRDMLDPLLDYCQHLACFKMAGQEFFNTIPMYQSFLRACGRMNSRLSALAFYRTAMEQPSMRQNAAMELTTQAVSSTSNPQSVYPPV